MIPIQPRTRFPRARCVTCGDFDACARRGEAEAAYPGCQVPIRNVDPARIARLFDVTRTGDDERLARLERVVLQRHRVDTTRYSELLEHSFSIDERGTHLYRFSYGIPWARREPQRGYAAFVELLAALGPGCGAAATKLARLAQKSGVVEQPIAGVADDGGAEGVRGKAYLQFTPDAGAHAFTLAGHVVGVPDLASRLPPLPLHLLGLDFAASGALRQAKLYLLAGAVAPSELPAGEAMEALADAGVERLGDTLLIHRLRHPDDPSLRVPEEIDFGLAATDVVWEDVRALPPFARLVSAATELERLGELTIAVRRLSVSAGRLTKLNAYYVLRERGPSL